MEAAEAKEVAPEVQAPPEVPETVANPTTTNTSEVAAMETDEPKPTEPQVSEPAAAITEPVVPEAVVQDTAATAPATVEEPPQLQTMEPPTEPKEVAPSVTEDVKPTVDAAAAGGDELNKTVQPMEAEEAKEAAPAKVEPETPTTEAPKPVLPQVANQAKKPKPDLSSLPTRQYLDQCVVPILLQGLSWLAKTRPDDPIEKLAGYLIEHKSEVEAGQQENINGS